MNVRNLCRECLQPIEGLGQDALNGVHYSCTINVESAARALFAHMMSGHTLDKWEDLKQDVRDHYTKLARVAVVAYLATMPPLRSER